MKIKTRELTLCAVLAALALALSYMESFFPLALIVPLPGVKLGLANIVTLYALYAIGFPSALAILLVRCTLGALFAGNASALLFSLLGGLSALLVMALLSGAKKLSIFGVSIAGAAAHNCGQGMLGLHGVTSKRRCGSSRYRPTICSRLPSARISSKVRESSLSNPRWSVRAKATPSPTVSKGSSRIR